MDKLPILVGFAGRKRAGKTLATEILMQAHGFIGMGFAQPMRTFVADLLGISQEDLDTIKEHPLPQFNGITPRKMLQTLGTEWGRDTVHPDLWVLTGMTAADRARAAGYAVAFSDVRFINEAEAIRQRGGYIIEIARDAAENSGDTHVSEAPLPAPLVDGTVVNNGTPQELYEAIVDELKRLNFRRDIVVEA
jgi:hypothetical protein